MFPLPSLRAQMLMKFGFDASFPAWLNREQTAIAILFPRTSFRTPEHLDLVGYITNKIASYGWYCETITWHDEKTFLLDDATYILGPHVEFAVCPATAVQTSCKLPILTS